MVKFVIWNDNHPVVTFPIANACLAVALCLDSRESRELYRLILACQGRLHPVLWGTLWQLALRATYRHIMWIQKILMIRYG